MNAFLNRFNFSLPNDGMASLALDVIVKATLLLLLAMIVDHIFRRASAAVRHRMWCLSFCGLLVLPLLTLCLPAWRFPILPPPSSQQLHEARPVSAIDNDANPSMTATERREPAKPDAANQSMTTLQEATQRRTEFVRRDNNTPASAFVTPQSPTPGTTASTFESKTRSFSWLALLLSIWGIGTGIAALPLVFGFISNTFLSRNANEVDCGEAQWLLPLQKRLDLNRPVRLLETAKSIVPITWGILRPIVLFPTCWREWTEERQQLVLLHELAHVKRFDVAYQVLARLTCSAYWFHPLAWYALRRLRIERELACDDCVLNTGAVPSAYARELVDLAQNYQRLTFPTTVAMAQTTNLETRVRCLLDKARARGPLSRSLAGALLLIAITLVTGIAVLKPAAQERTTLNSGTAAENDVVLHYKGRVVDPDGKPVAGAKLYFVYSFHGKPIKSMKPQATTKKDGSFEFDSRLSDMETNAKSIFYTRTLVAIADGYGFGATNSIYFETSGLAMKRLNPAAKNYFRTVYPDPKGEIRLTKDVPVRGRVINIEGRPVKGARLQIDRLWYAAKHNLDRWEAATKKRGATFYSARTETPIIQTGPQLNAVVPPVITDENGKFEIRGLGAERIAQLFLAGPGIEAAIIKVRTRHGDAIELQTNSGYTIGPGDEIPKDVYHPATFTHVAAPSKPVVGKIVDAESGKPLSNVIVSAGQNLTFTGFGKTWLNAKTDRDGEYRLDGLPVEGDHTIHVFHQGKKSKYIPVSRRIQTRSDDDEITANFKLRTGVMIRGKIRDAVTGKPVVGPVYYYADAQNPNLKDYKGFEQMYQYESRSDLDGNFEMPVIPGRGLLAFMADSHGKYVRGTGAKSITIRSAPSDVGGRGTLQFNTSPSLLFSTYVSLLKEINVRRGEAMPEIVLKPVPGGLITAKLYDPSGKPINSGKVLVENGGLQTALYDEHQHVLQIEGHSPKVTRKIWLYHQQRGLVGFVKLDGKVAQKIKIKMKRAASIRGRLVDDGGAPVADAKLMGTGLMLNRVDANVVTDENGRFHVRGLIPGRKYTIHARSDSSVLGTVLHRFSVDRAHVKDIGDIELKAFQRDREEDDK